MKRLHLIKHAAGAPGLRFFGMGPFCFPCKGLRKLKLLLDEHAFWAKDRDLNSIRKLLAGSNVVITLWRGMRIIGFGRATSDGIYRAVLWDVVVAGDLQGLGLGRQVVEALMSAPAVRKAERIYLMTTNSSEFYEQLDFKICTKQKLLIKKESL